MVGGAIMKRTRTMFGRLCRRITYGALAPQCLLAVFGSVLLAAGAQATITPTGTVTADGGAKAHRSPRALAIRPIVLILKLPSWPASWTGRAAWSTRKPSSLPTFTWGTWSASGKRARSGYAM